MEPPVSITLEHLRQQLHDANERHHAARQEWEKWLDANEFRHVERIEKARSELQEAEQAVEAIEAQIKKTMDGKTN